MDSSEHSSRCSEAHLFGAEFSDFHVSKEDSVEPRCDQLDTQLFEAEYLADEDPVLVPADVAAIVDSSQQETLRVRVLWQLARQSDRTGDVETCGNLVVQALVRALVIEHVAKVIESALLRAKRCGADTKAATPRLIGAWLMPRFQQSSRRRCNLGQ